MSQLYRISESDLLSRQKVIKRYVDGMARVWLRQHGGVCPPEPPLQLVTSMLGFFGRPLDSHSTQVITDLLRALWQETIQATGKPPAMHALGTCIAPTSKPITGPTPNGNDKEFTGSAHSDVATMDSEGSASDSALATHASTQLPPFHLRTEDIPMDEGMRAQPHFEVDAATVEDLQLVADGQQEHTELLTGQAVPFVAPPPQPMSLAAPAVNIFTDEDDARLTELQPRKKEPFCRNDIPQGTCLVAAATPMKEHHLTHSDTVSATSSPCDSEAEVEQEEEESCVRRSSRERRQPNFFEAPFQHAKEEWSTTVIAAQPPHPQKLFPSRVFMFKHAAKATSVQSAASGRCFRGHFPHYSEYEARLQTFRSWVARGCLVTTAVNPSTLAAAGFFHLPNEDGADRCACFYCGETLCDWVPEDIPRDEHCRQMPNCRFAQMNRHTDQESQLQTDTKRRNPKPVPDEAGRAWPAANKDCGAKSKVVGVTGASSQRAAGAEGIRSPKRRKVSAEQQPPKQIGHCARQPSRSPSLSLKKHAAPRCKLGTVRQPATKAVRTPQREMKGEEKEGGEKILSRRGHRTAQVYRGCSQNKGPVQLVWKKSFQTLSHQWRSLLGLSDHAKQLLGNPRPGEAEKAYLCRFRMLVARRGQILQARGVPNWRRQVVDEMWHCVPPATAQKRMEMAAEYRRRYKQLSRRVEVWVGLYTHGATPARQR
eukprot:GGOE01025383.1.p1 GENE.GGOE01025383.1~~GGOE01025383.1.p1  ORF type:complete len:710 (-),score=88.41 GGOE01025383.1:266-2395(-)